MVDHGFCVVLCLDFIIVQFACLFSDLITPNAHVDFLFCVFESQYEHRLMLSRKFFSFFSSRLVLSVGHGHLLFARGRP